MIDQLIKGFAEAVADVRERFIEAWTGRNEMRFPQTDWHFDPGNPAPPTEQLDALRDLFGLAEPSRGSPDIEKPGPEQGHDFER